ncbi:recombinase family protein [Streptomyces sp. NPDC002643]
MVSQRNKNRGAAHRRTPEDITRRQNIADAAAGIPFEPAATEGFTSRVTAFRVIIYLCAAPNANISVPRQQCREYAEAFGWEIVATVEDRDGLGHPKQREGLARVLERIERGEAGAVLTPSRSMISPIPQEYAEVARKVEKCGAFLQVAASERMRARTEG